jgi:hypothetical protein
MLHSGRLYPCSQTTGNLKRHFGIICIGVMETVMTLSACLPHDETDEGRSLTKLEEDLLTAAKYCISSLVLSVLPAPDSPVMTIT